MLIYLKVTHADGPNYTFIDDSIPLPPIAGLTTLDIKIEERTVTDRDRMQAHGKNPAFAYHGGMTLDLEGDLFRDTSDEYVTERKNLLAALYGPPDTMPSVRAPVKLELKYLGDTEVSFCDCVLMDRSMPIKGGYPAYTQYMITLYSFLPWFIGETSGDLYYF